ncbi:hypothetical protein AX769_15835 [Frondihabitans sp. PAMC 28766]|nr:hypothetical protein AX769_15835 [Frondihabitans sp. PAMC 28766]
MIITVEDTPHFLWDLLWVREAWQLEPTGDDLPPRLVDATARETSRPAPLSDRGAWEAAWPDLWRGALEHAGLPRDHSIYDRLILGDLEPEEQRRLMRVARGPTWHDRFDDSAFDERREAWTGSHVRALIDRQRRPLKAEPERVCLEALIPAWRSGLTTIVEIPCDGSFTRVLGPHGLLVTASTRSDPSVYAEALAGFHEQ